MRALPALCLLLLLAVACDGGGRDLDLEPTAPATLTVTGPAFEDGGTIPRRFSCDGADEPPPLSWAGLPESTRQVVVTVTDPDAPSGTFVHWMAVLPPDVDRIVAGETPAGTVEGRNDRDERGYAGPCPPEGDPPHRYVFTVHALAAESELQPGFSAPELRSELEGAILATGRLTGRYGR